MSTVVTPRKKFTRAHLRAGAIVAIAIAFMNLFTYGYTILAAHTIGRQAYGAFAALLGVLLVANVLSLGLQATGARRIAAVPGDAAAIEQVILTVGLRSALCLGLLLAALAPVFNSVLRLESLPAALLLAVAVVPQTYMGAQAGVLQGERRWTSLAMVYLSQGVGRVAAGLVLILIWPNELAAMAGVAFGAWLPVIVGGVALRQRRHTRSAEGGHPGWDLLREVAGSSHALLAFFALSNVDIVVARAVLSDSQAGLYAGGLILVKAMLFLPQSVVVIAFPTMASTGTSHHTLLLAIGTAAAIGVAGVAGVLLLPGLAQLFIGGDDFAGVSGDLWKFAIVGTILSMVQILVYSVLARRHQKATVLIWVALGALIAGALAAGSTGSLVLTVLVVDAIVLLALLVLAFATLPGSRAGSGAARQPA